MPKWTEYTSKDTLADNDEVMLYDATAKANKRGLMSKFWDYVVDKMATAVISKLETDNKTIIGAINALNGKCSFKSASKTANISIANEYVYTGLAFEIPKNTLAVITAKAIFNKSEPLGVSLVNSDSVYSYSTIIETSEKYPTSLTCIVDKSTEDKTYYIWVKYSSVGDNVINAYGLLVK